MQVYAAYNGPTITVRAECFNNAINWTLPSSEEIKLVLSEARMTTTDFAEMINEPVITIENWLSSNAEIPYSAWCLLCASAGYGQIWK